MRLFVAVNPPSRLRAELDTRLDTIRSALPLAWTHPAAWHLTLMFLGEWSPERVPGLAVALGEAVRPQAPFPVLPGRVGAFPELDRPRVLILHLDGGDPLRQTADQVRDTVDRIWPDGPQDHKPLRPHLTLARVKRPLGAAELARLRALDLGVWEPFTAAAAQLIASELRREGPRYTVVADLPFGG
jgi:RNA 2',3'-cyclic 3'-phosphodiesterase